MTALKRFLALSPILALAMAACSVTIDLGTQPLSGRDKASTMVAQTLQAFTQQALSAVPTNTPLPTPTTTPSNTPMPATLSVSAATNCYAGPSSNYGFVITIRPGTIATVLGKDTADNYWIIDTPGYPGTLCWLSGQYAQVSGDTGNLPAPATPLASIYTLSEPRNLRVSCSSETISDPDGEGWHDESEWTVDFRWTNTEPDQTGVRVYRNGRLIATLRGHASSYTDIFFQHGRHHYTVTYGVQAFKSGAVSSIVTTEVRRCK